MATTDFTIYQPPGVFVEEELSPIVSIIGAGGPTIVALVGPAVGYQTYGESVVLSGSTASSLKQLGINPASVVVTTQDGAIQPGSAYSLTVGAGADGDIGITTDNTLTIARNGSAIADGATVFVTYRYTNADYLQPTSFNDFDAVKDMYGQPIDPLTSAILSPLSMAAKVAIENGARQLVCVATAGLATAVTRQALIDGMNKLNALDVNIVVPLPVGITGTPNANGDVINVANDLALHCDSAAVNNLFRVGIIGHETTSTVASNVIASSVGDRRVMLAFPNAMNYFNGFANQTVQISGYYLACAYAGIFASFQPREPLTRKRVRSFAGIPVSVLNTMTPLLKNTYSAAGVSVTERRRDGSIICRHGVSTDKTNVVTREFSLTRSRDALVNLINLSVDATGLIGTPIDLDTPARIKGVMTGILETAVGSQIIVAYNNIKVRQRSIDPTVMEVKFQYLPAFPLNYIVISFSINLQSGATDIIDQAVH